MQIIKMSLSCVIIAMRHEKSFSWENIAKKIIKTKLIIAIITKDKIDISSFKVMKKL